MDKLLKDVDLRGKINIVVPSAETSLKDRLEYPDAMVIDYETAMQHSKWTHDNGYRLHGSTLKYAGFVFKKRSDVDLRLDLTDDNWFHKGNGVVHLIGRIDLTLKIWQQAPVSIVWKYPEAGIHPAAQCEIADLLIRIHKRFILNNPGEGLKRL